MKNIMHLQIPIDKNGKPLMPWDSVIDSINSLKEQLPKYYKVIASPFNIITNKKTITIDTTNVNNMIHNQEIIDKLKDMIEYEGYIVKVIK